MKLKDIELRNGALFLIIGAASLFLFILALGPGLYSIPGAQIYNWQYQGFDLLCHQLPDRSFKVSGFQMAVCSRCIGIYGAFMVGWLLLPFLWKVNISLRSKIGWLIGLIILNLADVFGNFIGLWTNTLYSRMILGIMLGLSVAILFTNEFFSIKNQVKYGK